MRANSCFILKLVVAAYCWQVTTSLFALAPYTLQAPMQGDPLGLYFLTYEDKTQTLDLQGVLEAEKNGLFAPSKEEVPNYGLNPSAQWVKFSLHNPSEQTIEIYLENGIPFVDEFELFWQEDGRWQVKRGGDQIDFNTRDIQTRQVVFHLFLEPGTHTFYARTIALGTMQLPLRVWTLLIFMRRMS